jgi:hypothetical protein
MQIINGIRKLMLALVLVATMPQIAHAQDSDLRPVSSKYAIKNATIVQAPGRVIQNGTILFENGVIKAVGVNVTIPADAWVINADSMYVYAGFISGLSNIGVPKPKEERERPDPKLRSNPPYKLAGITPEASVTDMLSHEEKSIEEFRQLGFTAAHTVPHSGMMPGKSALILLGGNSAPALVIKKDFAQYGQLASASGVYPSTFMGVMAKYRDMYGKAKLAMEYESRYKAGSNGMERPVADLTLEALYPVVSKQQAVFFQSENILDIMRVLALKNDIGFNLALGEVKQGWDAADQIKSSGSSVFLSLDLPELKEEKKDEKKKEDGKEEEKKEEKPKEKTAADLEKEALEKRQKEMIAKYYSQPATFTAKGIKYGFSTLNAKSKDVKTTLNNMIKNGLTEDQALAALTTQPAELLGVAGTMGTLDNGKMANMVITDKPYFDEKANVRYVFVDGTMYTYEVKEKKKGNSNGEAAKPQGSWSYSYESPQGPGQGVIEIKGTPGNYSGTMTLSFNQSTNDIKNLEVDGANVSFTVDVDAGGQIIILEISMTINGDSFEGTLTAGAFGSFPLEGTRTPEK